MTGSTMYTDDADSTHDNDNDDDIDADDDADDANDDADDDAEDDDDDRSDNIETGSRSNTGTRGFTLCIHPEQIQFALIQSNPPQTN